MKLTKSWWYREFLGICGDLHAAILLSAAFFWDGWKRSHGDEDGWFYKTCEQWEDEIGLGKHAQIRARKELRDKNFLFEERRGNNPPLTYFRVNREGIEAALSKVPKRNIRKSESAENGKSRSGPPKVTNGHFPPYRKRNTQRHTETKPCAAGAAAVEIVALTAHSKSEHTDPRHASTRALIRELYERSFREICTWQSEFEGKALDRLLQANPEWPQDALDRMVRNAFASANPPRTPPRRWLSNLSDWIQGPLDRYKNPDPGLLVPEPEPQPQPKAVCRAGNPLCDGGWYQAPEGRTMCECEKERRHHLSESRKTGLRDYDLLPLEEWEREELGDTAALAQDQISSTKPRHPPTPQSLSPPRRSTVARFATDQGGKR